MQAAKWKAAHCTPGVVSFSFRNSVICRIDKLGTQPHLSYQTNLGDKMLHYYHNLSGSLLSFPLIQIRCALSVE